jgi:RimJ/RimL family protein N-acetyltransferase
MRHVPTLETPRLRIRAFAPDDAEAYQRISDLCFGDGSRVGDANAITQTREMLHWLMLNDRWLHNLLQAPYGDRAVVLKETGELIGGVGLVALLDAFDQLPSFGGAPNALHTTEMGLFWCIAPAHQRKGYASEAAQALITHVFTVEKLKRIVATTDYDNLASQAVMTKLGMRLERNPFPEPPWLQVVGILENASA